MGGNKTNQQTNQMLTTQLNQENSGFNSFNTRNNADLDQAKGHANDLYSSIESGYKNLLDPSTAIGGVAASGGGGGGANASTAGDPRFAETENAYRQFMSTGGWTPDQEKDVNSDIGALRTIGQTGGVSDDQIARIRGNGVFDEFAKTGGLSDADKSNIRTRATSVIPSLYANIKAQGDRAAVTQGGYGPGQQAMMLKAARDQKSGLADASLNAELGITDKVNAGREWGASSLSGAEQGLAGLQSSNRLQGLQGASGLEMGNINSINSGKQYGTSGLEGMAQADRQAALEAAGINSSAGRSGAALQLQSYLSGLGGLQSLYTSSPTEYQEDKDFDLKNRGLNDQATLGFLSGRQQEGSNFWGSLAGGIGSLV